jgi:hypothetical protein
MPGVEPPQQPGVHIQAGKQRGSERAVPELGGDRGVDLGGDLGQIGGVARACR